MTTYLTRHTGKLSVMFGVLAAAGWLAAAVFARESGNPPKVTVSSKPIDRSSRAGLSYAPVVKKVALCVVNVYSERTVRVPRFWGPFMQDPLWRRFFGGDPDQNPNQPQTRQQRSLGSGVIVTEDGYILTNNHVVEGADKGGVKVALANDKTEYTAEVVGTDPQTDVAVLKIEAKDLKPITLGDSDQIEVGDVALAIGNPFDIGQSVTMGIISALGRGFGILGREGYEDFIQTDAPINPGNSGGALVDVEGRLIGINQSIVSGSGASAGVGFAVPINLARSIMDRLVTDGKVLRGYLGVGIQPVTPELAQAFKLEEDSGALVGSVQPKTPAAEAGLQRGDVIIEFNGKKVTDSRHFRLMVAQNAPRTKVTMKLIRNGKEKTVSATLGTLPEELGGSGEDEQSLRDQSRSDALDGVVVDDLDSRTRRQYDIPADIQGALVTKVEPGSPAEKDLKPGDVIVEINQKPVRNADEAVTLSERIKADTVLLLVWSKDGGFAGTRWVVVKNDKEK